MQQRLFDRELKAHWTKAELAELHHRCIAFRMKRHRIRQDQINEGLRKGGILDEEAVQAINGGHRADRRRVK